VWETTLTKDIPRNGGAKRVWRCTYQVSWNVNIAYSHQLS
jgi:hypothetical protein